MAETAAEKVLFEVEGLIGIITLNRPHKLNALDRDVWERICAVAFELPGSGVRAAILTGAGDKAFCAGLDLKPEKIPIPGSPKESSDAAWLRFYHDHVVSLRLMFDQLETCPIPVIAAINGYCLGGALELALCCDIRLCSDDAVFSIPETAIGIVPDMGGTQRLPRVVGIGKAKELIFSGRKIKADEALRIGLVEHVYPKAELMKEAKQLAAEIAKNAPLAVQASKRAINLSQNTPLAVGLQQESLLASTCLISKDSKEGLLSFALKKEPDYKGK